MINAGDSDRGAKAAPDVSNELGNYCCADRQLPLDYLWTFDAPAPGSAPRVRAFTRKRSLFQGGPDTAAR
jgi:hypothetical protein